MTVVTTGTVIYWLIAAATITFSKRKGAATATMQGRPLNLCRVPSSGGYTVPMFQM